jgi:hypothetical protein
MRNRRPGRKSTFSSFSSHFTYLPLRKSRAEQDWDKTSSGTQFHTKPNFNTRSQVNMAVGQTK